MPSFRLRQTLLLVLLLASQAAAADWYVSGSGSDSNAGTSSGVPYRTLAKAAGRVAPGDTVWVMNGIYTNAMADWDLVNLNTSGTSGAWIAWKAMPGHAPELRFTGWNGFKIAASYLIIDGFIITGAMDSVTLAQAQADELLPSASAVYNGTGIGIDGRGVTAKYHHITIRKCTGGGIQFIQSDYITVEDCLIRDNCWYGRYAQSGLSLWQCWNFDTAAGYHNALRRNTLCNNKTLVNWVAIGALSDGNGIIFDDSKNTQNGSTLGAYTGRTLISDNLSVANGGSGIHAYESEHVDIVNNTAYQNGQVVGYGDIFAGSCNDVRILDNIMSARTGGKVNDNWSNTSVTYDYNVYFNGTVAISGAHDVVADPKFTSPGLDTASADFRVQAASPAVDSGTTIAGVTSVLDHDHIVRPQGSAIDRGAYERASSAGTLALSASTYTRSEGKNGSRTATVTVNRSGGSAGAASVQYATSNGTATAGSDYAAASGTLTWTDGDATAKTFLITVYGDQIVEGNETLTITLSGVTGAVFGSPSTAVLTIPNDDTAK